MYLLRNCCGNMPMTGVTYLQADKINASLRRLVKKKQVPRIFAFYFPKTFLILCQDMPFFIVFFFKRCCFAKPKTTIFYWFTAFWSASSPKRNPSGGLLPTLIFVYTPPQPRSRWSGISFWAWRIAYTQGHI